VVELSKGGVALLPVPVNNAWSNLCRRLSRARCALSWRGTTVPRFYAVCFCDWWSTRASQDTYGTLVLSAGAKSHGWQPRCRRLGSDKWMSPPAKRSYLYELNLTRICEGRTERDAELLEAGSCSAVVLACETFNCEVAALHAIPYVLTELQWFP